MIKDIRNVFRVKKKTKQLKTIIVDIRNFLELKVEKKYYKPVRVCNCWSNN